MLVLCCSIIIYFKKVKKIKISIRLKLDMCYASVFLQLDMLRPEEFDFGVILGYIRLGPSYDT